MPGRVLNDDDVAAIVAEFASGTTRVALAARFGVHPNTISRVQRRSGVASRLGLKRALGGDDELRLVDAYVSGIPTAEIAAGYGISAVHVSRVALKNGALPRRPNLPGRPRILDETTASQVVDEYRDGASIRRLASDHGVSPATVLRVLERAEVPRRARSVTRRD